MAWLSHAHLHAAPPPLAIPGLPPGIDELYLACLAKDPSERPTAEQALQLLAPHTHGTAADRSATADDDATQLLPAVEAAAPLPDAPRPAAKHGGNRVRLDRRVLLPVALLLAALGVVSALMLALARAIPSGTAAAAPGITATATTTVGTASTTPSVQSVILPSASIPASASPSQSATPSPNSALALPDPAADPLGYLQAVSTQIQALVAQGPATLQAGAGQGLHNAVAALESVLASAQQNGGKKQWRDVRNGIASVEQQISGDAAAGRISQAAAGLLTGELQRLANRLPANGD
jgi:hypothetical protein